MTLSPLSLKTNIEQLYATAQALGVGGSELLCLIDMVPGETATSIEGRFAGEIAVTITPNGDGPELVEVDISGRPIALTSMEALKVAGILITYARRIHGE